MAHIQPLSSSSSPSLHQGNLPPDRLAAPTSSLPHTTITTTTTTTAHHSPPYNTPTPTADFLANTPAAAAATATRNFQMQSQREARKLTLSNMTFFRDAIRISGSCLPRILPSVLGIVLWSAAIYIADTYCGRHWSSSATIIAPLSVVVGLLLVFRNATSYDRWYEGRKLWASTTAEASMLARYLWANVQVDVVSSDHLTGQTGSGVQVQGGESAENPHLAVSPHALDNMSHHRVSTPSMIFGRMYDMSLSQGPTRPSSAAGASASASTSAANHGSRPISDASDVTTDSSSAAAAARAIPPLAAPLPPLSRPDPVRGATQEDITRRIEKKRKAIRLLILFIQSLAHELRGDKGINWLDYQDVLPDDLRTLWSQQTTTTTAFSENDEEDGDDKSSGSRRHEDLSPITESQSDDRGQGVQSVRTSDPTRTARRSEGASEGEEDGKRNPWRLLSWYTDWRDRRRAQEVVSVRPLSERTPLLPTHGNDRAARSSALATPAEMSLSLLALYQLGRYIASARKAGMLNDAGPAGTSLANNMIQALSQARASLDRIANTAIPLVSGIHLKQCTLLYLLALPLTLVSELGWKSVPFTGLVAITLLGLEGISSEVEMPFGDDQSDHNLALWIAQFRMEVEGLLAELAEGADVGLCL